MSITPSYMNISLKRATEADVEAYLWIEEAVHSSFNLVTTDRDEAQSEIADNMVLMIRLDDHVVGLITYKLKNEHEAHLVELAVHPNFQGRGIGGEALTMILDTLRAQGCTTIDVDTHPENRALHLYERHGFKVVGRIENYDNSGTPRLTLVRTL